MVTTNKKYHRLAMLWITDSAKFQDYFQKMSPIVAKYGGIGDRIIQPTAIWADGFKLPNIVTLVHYDSKKALEDFNHDPEYKKIEHLRDESLRFITYEGYLNFENSSDVDLTEREYNIEIVTFKNGNAKAYNMYENDGENKMKEYGFVVEYKMTADSHSESVWRPDLIKISYFKNAAGKADFEKDPMHKRIERELYPDAVGNVVWISGKPQSAIGQ